MTIRATVLTAAAALLLSAGAAQAQNQGILTCQIGVTQFAEDVIASKERLSPGQLEVARDLIEVARSQCRSSPGIVAVNVQSARQQMNLSTGRRAGSQFDSFWPASEAELSMVRE